MSFVRVVLKGGAAVDVRDGVAPLQCLARGQIEMLFKAMGGMTAAAEVHLLASSSWGGQ